MIQHPGRLFRLLNIQTVLQSAGFLIKGLCLPFTGSIPGKRCMHGSQKKTDHRHTFIITGSFQPFLFLLYRSIIHSPVQKRRKRIIFLIFSAESVKSRKILCYFRLLDILEHELVCDRNPKLLIPIIIPTALAANKH